MDCIIIEDQPPAQRILKKYIEDFGNLTLKGTFPDAIQAMTFLSREKVDLIFLDIHLPKISGIDFLKTMNSPPYIILTTAFPDYALESYEFNVVDYLLKPFSFQRFVKAMAKISSKVVPAVSATEELSQTGLVRKEIFIKSGYEHIKINLGEIDFIQSDGDYTEIHTDSKKHLSSEPLSYWTEFLSDFPFERVHKSFIINTAKIQKIVGNQVYLTDRNVIPIGRTYREDFLKKVLK